MEQFDKENEFVKGVLTLADKANQTLVMQAGLVLLSS